MKIESITITGHGFKLTRLLTEESSSLLVEMEDSDCTQYSFEEMFDIGENFSKMVEYIRDLKRA